MPTREIAWNVSEVALVVMYALMAVQGLALAYGFTRRYVAWRKGKPYGPNGEVDGTWTVCNGNIRVALRLPGRPARRPIAASTHEGLMPQ